VASVLQKLKLRQLNRLSVTLDDLADAQSLTIGNEVVQMFDVIAATPGNAKVFAYLCKTADIDIITLDLGRRIPFQLNKKLIDEAVARGICFELCYSVILGSSASRKEMLSSSRTLVQYLRGRNLIFSSNADSVGQLRGPADVMNIAFSLGITAEFSVHTITRNSAQVVRHAACRKLRYLPAEIIAGADFQTRWPELMLPDLQLLLQPQSSSKKRQRDQELDEEEQEHEEVAEVESEVALPGGIEQGDGDDFLSF
jgi:ribonuclease P/MRP protein subunit RPP1